MIRQLLRRAELGVQTEIEIRRLQVEHHRQMEVLRKQIADGAGAAADQRVARHRLHIADNLLTRKCPGCQVSIQLRGGKSTLQYLHLI